MRRLKPQPRLVSSILKKPTKVFPGDKNIADVTSIATNENISSKNHLKLPKDERIEQNNVGIDNVNESMLINYEEVKVAPSEVLDTEEYEEQLHKTNNESFLKDIKLFDESTGPESQMSAVELLLSLTPEETPSSIQILEDIMIKPGDENDEDSLSEFSEVESLIDQDKSSLQNPPVPQSVSINPHSQMKYENPISSLTLLKAPSSTVVSSTESEVLLNTDFKKDVFENLVKSDEIQVKEEFKTDLNETKELFSNQDNDFEFKKPMRTLSPRKQQHQLKKPTKNIVRNFNRSNNQASTIRPGSSYTNPSKRSSQRVNTFSASDSTRRRSNIPSIASPFSEMSSQCFSVPLGSADAVNSVYIQNIVVTFCVGCKLDLQDIHFRSRNSEYSPARFHGIVMRIREPRSTALIFSTGKIIVTGTNNEFDANWASKKFCRILSLLGYELKPNSYTIQNIVATCDLRFPIRLEDLHQLHGQFSSYEPELFPGLIYRMVRPRMVLLIFVNGKIVFTGAKSRNMINECLENIHPILRSFRKQ